MAGRAPGPAGRGELYSRARNVRNRLAASPWPRWLSRWLSVAAGALLIAAPLRPWVYVPFGGLRLPVFGLFSLAGLALAAGLFLLFHPRPGPGPLLVIALAAWYLAAAVPAHMLLSARSTTGIVESWIDPLNQLLSRFHIQELRLVDWTLPVARTVGPGVSLALWGAGLALAAAVAAVAAIPPVALLPRSCSSCDARLARRSDLRFCPGCGAALTAVPVCGRCGSAGEPGDRYCGRCGERLPTEQTPRQSR